MTATLPAAVETASADLICATNISKSFGALQVLKGISLTARSHQVVSLLGSSGSGKSTLLRCINMLEIPTGGTVSIDGEIIEMKAKADGSVFVSNPKQLRKIRATLGMVFQSFNLWSHMTILENVMAMPVHVLGKSKAEAKEIADHYLDKVGLFEKGSAYPAFLSGGQQQRAAIARALAIEPKAILMDEPTSALDPELVGEVLNVIRGLAEEGRTMLVVTHEMAFAKEVSSKVLFLHQGKVEEEGAPQELFGNPKSERLRGFLTRARH